MTKQKSKSKPKSTQSLSQSKVERLKNGNIEIEITIPWLIVADEYQKTLENLAKSTRVKGFRPGKAPKKLVEKQAGKTKVFQETAKTLLTEVYLEAVKTHKLMPVVNPRLNLISSEEGKDWQVKAVVAEIPEVKLGNYKDEVKKTLAPEKIWTPGKTKEPEEKKEENQEKRLQKIFQILLEKIELTVPQLLIEDEINRMLSRLIDQTARLGLTIDQYLTSINKTTDQLRDEYKKQAKESIELELILSAIANQENFKVDDKEIEALIKAVGDQKSQKSLETPTQKAYLRQILRKRKVIDMLSKL